MESLRATTRILLSPFSFRGRVKRAPFLLASVVLLAVPCVFVLAVFAILGKQPPAWHSLLFAPAAHLMQHLGPNSPFTLLGLAVTLLSLWLLAALAMRRATDIGTGGWTPAWVMVPILQCGAILYLSALPSLADDQTEARRPASSSTSVWPAIQGVMAGVAVTLSSVALGALVFGGYGYTMFLLSPFVVGGVIGYLANREGEIGSNRTAFLVASGTAIGGLGLIAFALEGAVCIVLAAPLWIGVAIVGGVFGEAAARIGKDKPGTTTLMSIAALPLAFAVEHALPPTTSFETRETVVVAAPRAAVWQAVTHMGTIEAEPSVLFRLGMAYPTAGVIHGRGVGAIREGHFSTGVAYERVTEWSPGRRLTFDVLSDAPSLRELSPYEHVNAPHVDGYFRTRTAQFDLTPLPGGRTRLSLTTVHDLDLDPTAYWVPIAKWVTHQNKVRVLEHFRRLAEGQPPSPGFESQAPNAGPPSRRRG